MRIHLLLAAASASALQTANAVAPDQPGCPHATTLASTTNENGVPHGEPDPKIKCAFFRVINPRTDKYVNFRDDVDKGGLDEDLIDEAGWPMVFIQQGYRKSLNEGAGLDTNDLDGYFNGVLSHEDLMWPHRAEIANFLKERQGEDGTISAADLFDAKKLTSEKYGMEKPTFGSYNEIPLICQKCGGNVETGRVPLKSVLEFYDGKPPSVSGRITRDGLNKWKKILEDDREASPSLLTFGKKDPKGLFKFVLAAKGLQGKMKKKVLGL